MPTFSALASTLLAPPILLAPVLGGWLIDLAGYRALFAVGLAIAALGWGLLRWGVREPRHAR